MHSREANYPIEVDDVNGEGDDDGILNSQWAAVLAKVLAAAHVTQQLVHRKEQKSDV